MIVTQSLLPENRRKTGEQLLEILQKESGKAIPSEGFLAGQSVTSAFMQLHNLQGVEYNDLDLFFEYSNKPLLLREGLWHDRLHEPIRSITAGKLRSSEYEAPGLFNEFLGGSNEYCGVPMEERVLKMDRGIVINRVTRNQEFNNIVFTPITTYDNIDKDRLYSLSEEARARLHAQVMAKNVLRSFDLNSVKIGIDLKSRELITEKSFHSWVANRQLTLDHVQTPIQSFIRFLDKLQHVGNYGNVEFELAKTFCLLTYRNLAGFAYHASRIIGTPEKAAEFEKITALYNLVVSSDWVKASREYLAEKLQQDGPSTFFESSIQAFKDLPPIKSLDSLCVRFGDYGINVIGQKYYDRALRHPVVLEHFEFVKVDHCYIVLPKKAPRLIKEFGIEFFMYAANSGLGFMDDHQSVVNPISLANPSVDKKTKTVISAFGQMPQKQRTLVVSALAVNNKLNSEKIVDSDFLIGVGDTVNEKYVDLAMRHKHEIEKISRVTNLRVFYSCLKKLYNAIDRAFKIQNEYLFFAMFNKFESAVRTLNRLKAQNYDQNVVEISDDVYNAATSVEDLVQASIEEQYAQKCKRDLSLPLYSEVVQFQKYMSQGMTAVCSEEFVDFCLNTYVSSNERQSAHKKVELNEKIPTEVVQQVITALEKSAEIQIRELNTALELETEGFKMSHCVGGYSSYVQNGRSRIFSLSLKTLEGFEFSTLEIQSSSSYNSYSWGASEVNTKNDKWRFVQNRGVRNSTPSSDLMTAGYLLLTKINEYEQKLLEKTQSVVVDNSRHSSALAKNVGVSR